MDKSKDVEMEEERKMHVAVGSGWRGDECRVLVETESEEIRHAWRERERRGERRRRGWRLARRECGRVRESVRENGVKYVYAYQVS